MLHCWVGGVRFSLPNPTHRREVFHSGKAVALYIGHGIRFGDSPPNLIAATVSGATLSLNLFSLTTPSRPNNDWSGRTTSWFSPLRSKPLRLLPNDSARADGLGPCGFTSQRTRWLSHDGVNCGWDEYTTGGDGLVLHRRGPPHGDKPRATPASSGAPGEHGGGTAVIEDAGAAASGAARYPSGVQVQGTTPKEERGSSDAYDQHR
ncbi:hypothetical protein RHMOL_Rhmol07G0156600 [Rhododendron molle]|uniref:Uncharacterized protein n=1 Tax=Rhododendron molle TaxID=49168 RepID=A0ACC0N0T9_RHOML|nr:hypothetical protein RHMOL_Rhmol07G0156600 [Rhododendron molle]